MPNKKIQKKTAKRAPAKVSAKSAKVSTNCATHFDSSRFSLYVYWFIILFFVSATCYILGRSYSITNPIRGAEISESFAMNMSNLSPEERAKASVEYLESGKEKLFAGNYVGAITDLTMSIDAAPSAMAFIYRGEAFMQNSNYDNALADLTNAAKLEPSNAIAYYDGALVYMRLEKLNDARAALSIALDAFNRQPTEYLTLREIYAKRAQVNLWLKDWAAAAADYTSAIDSSTVKNYLDFAGRAEAYTGLEQYRAAANDYLSAVTIISETIANVPETSAREDMSRNAMMYFEKSGALHVALNEMDAARADLSAALTLATSLGDTDTVDRMGSLLENM